MEVRSLLYPYKHPRTTIFTFTYKVRPSSAAAADIAHVIISETAEKKLYMEIEEWRGRWKYHSSLRYVWKYKLLQQIYK